MDQSSPPHQDKAEGVKGAKAGENDDMAHDASFYVFSFGDAGAMREFTIQRGSGKPGAKDQAKQLKPEDIVWQKILANGSLLRVSAPDNREYHHALHPMKGAGQRWSLIFRVIKTFIPIEPDVAAEVNNRMYRFVSKAQLAEGRVAPTPTELTAFAKSQSSFRTCPQRKQARERREKIPGIPLHAATAGPAAAAPAVASSAVASSAPAEFEEESDGEWGAEEESEEEESEEESDGEWSAEEESEEEESEEESNGEAAEIRSAACPNFVLQQKLAKTEEALALANARLEDEGLETVQVESMASVSEPVWRPWQRDLLNLIEPTSDGRTVFWVHEPEGGSGKSKVLVPHLEKHHGALVIQPSAKQEMLSRIKKKHDKSALFRAKPIIFINLPRAESHLVEGKVMYALIERLQDDFTPKAGGETLNWGGVYPHVVVTANAPPDVGFIVGRLKVFFINADDRLVPDTLVQGPLDDDAELRREERVEYGKSIESGAWTQRLLELRRSGGGGGAGGSGNSDTHHVRFASPCSPD